jgi:hypothetical protein
LSVILVCVTGRRNASLIDHSLGFYSVFEAARVSTRTYVATTISLFCTNLAAGRGRFALAQTMNGPDPAPPCNQRVPVEALQALLDQNG